MGKSTFSGPVRSGTVREGASANVGNAVMAQSAAWTQSTTNTDTGIKIPANSRIIDIAVYVTSTPSAATMSIGTTSGGSEISSFAIGTTNNVILFASGGTKSDVDVWEDVGSSDVSIWIDFSAVTTVGAGTLTVQYVQV
jgi:hypothetical protein